MVGYFEIAVADLDRAKAFYSAVFDVEFTPFEIHGNVMALFPDPIDAPGAITGALSQGSAYIPGTSGTIVYFTVPSVAATLNRAIEARWIRVVSTDRWPATSASWPSLWIVKETASALTGPA